LKLDDDDVYEINLDTTDALEVVSGVHGYVNGASQNDATIGARDSSPFVLYSGILFQAGRLAYLARAGGRYFENHFFGDPSCAYAAGHLFRLLLENPRWLSDYARVSDEEIPKIIQAHLFDRLREAREYAGRILFLPELYKGVPEPGDLYQEVFQPIRLRRHIKVDRMMYAASDDAFGCVAQLRGMIMATALEDTLERRFGDKWYEEESAGRFLSELWRPGQHRSVEEFADRIGVSGLDPVVLSAHVASQMGSASPAQVITGADGHLGADLHNR
jgi:hypothetical protein